MLDMIGVDQMAKVLLPFQLMGFAGEDGILSWHGKDVLNSHFVYIHTSSE